MNVNHSEFVSLYYSNKVNVFINQSNVCQLCNYVKSNTPSKGMEFRSTHLWFWLLPALSTLLFLSFPWYIGILGIFVALIISVTQIGPAVRKAATNCVIEAVLLDQLLYENLIN